MLFISNPLFGYLEGCPFMSGGSSGGILIYSGCFYFLKGSVQVGENVGRTKDGGRRNGR